jgi:hypothetical protein
MTDLEEIKELIDSFESDVIDGQSWYAGKGTWKRIEESKKELIDFIEKALTNKD